MLPGTRGTSNELRAPRYTSNELRAPRYTSNELRAARYITNELRAPRYTSKELNYLPVTTVMGTRPVEELHSDGSGSDAEDSGSEGVR